MPFVIIIILCLIWHGIKKVIMSDIKEKNDIRMYNSSNYKETAFNMRVRELNLNLDKAIKVLVLPKGDPQWGRYVYLWHEDGALAMFFSTETVGDCELTSSPREWDVTYTEKSMIEGLYNRNNYCQINFKDGSNAKFGKLEYEKIKELLTTSGLI